MAERDEHVGDPGKAGVDIENVCEACDQKELCPVYMGQGCLLVQERNT